MSDLLIVKAKVKDAAKGYNVAGDVAEALDKKVKGAVEDACKRAQDNGRKTVMANDVPHIFSTASRKSDIQLIVKAKIKDAAKGCNVAGDLSDALNQLANMLISEACHRAEANGRKTVMGKDV